VENVPPAGWNGMRIADFFPTPGVGVTPGVEMVGEVRGWVKKGRGW